MQVNVNLIGVLVATVAAMIIGGLWYSPIMFAGTWLKALNKRKEDLKGAGKAMFVQLIATLVTAYFLSLIISLVGAVSAVSGAKVGFWIWLGFVFTISLSNYMFEARPKKLFYIFAGYHLINFLVMGAILGAWR